MPTATKRRVAKFWDLSDIADYIGMKSVRSMSRIKLPPHDAEIGGGNGREPFKGWLPATIKEWNETRPGSGRWGAR